MTGFMRKLFHRRPKKSADVAAERLKIILAHERRGVSAPLMEQMKEEIIQVVSKFVEVDSHHIDVRLTDEADIEMLEVTVPFQHL
ncbi:cell division topological specificity factor MinE [candidate division KSB3 bacterium]|uniref:Cell division topological specificity factor n=1 Tax=candidate division KSB3 bacterium TaxID=2044937 RepID=A0A2G6KHD3_9BACT|nr:MAG: cell division topological specificity factor MinE [candidate division KSB3 bacterium]